MLAIKVYCGQLPHKLLDFKSGNFVLARVFFTTERKESVAILILYSDCHDLEIEVVTQHFSRTNAMVLCDDRKNGCNKITLRIL